MIINVMTRRRSANRFLLGVLLVVVIHSNSFAQKSKEESISRAILKLPVRVESPDGKPWDAGKRNSFKVFSEDSEIPLKSFLDSRSPMIILTVFDTAVDPARVENARTTFIDEIKKLNQNVWIGLLRSQDGLAVIQEPTADRKLIEEKIRAIQVSGKAGLLDTLQPVSALAAGILQKAGVRLCVLYITDSGIANYRADYLNPVINASDAGDLSRRFSDRAVQEQVSRIADSLDQFAIPIFILHLAYRTDTLNLAYQSGLEKIADRSAGAALLCRTPDEIKPAFDQMLSRILSTYFLGVELQGAKKSLVKFRVEAMDPLGNAFEKVSYREQLRFKKKR